MPIRENTCNVCGEVGRTVRLQVVGLQPNVKINDPDKVRRLLSGTETFDVCRPITAQPATAECLKKVVASNPMLVLDVIDEQMGDFWSY